VSTDTHKLQNTNKLELSEIKKLGSETSSDDESSNDLQKLREEYDDRNRRGKLNRGIKK